MAAPLYQPSSDNRLTRSTLPYGVWETVQPGNRPGSIHLGPPAGPSPRLPLPTIPGWLVPGDLREAGAG